MLATSARGSRAVGVIEPLARQCEQFVGARAARARRRATRCGAPPGCAASRRASGAPGRRSAPSAPRAPAPPSRPRRSASARARRRRSRSASRRSRGRPRRSAGSCSSAAARTTISSLNDHRSSSEPPPRATIRRSGRGMRPLGGSALKPRIAAATCSAEPSPCTCTGQTSTRRGKRSASRCRMSRITAPVGEVMTPITSAGTAAAACAPDRTGLRRRASSCAPRPAPSARRARPARASRSRSGISTGRDRW